MSEVITRFAPSPTGFLHIGGARTALFNYLYSKKMGGKYYLRIENTDRQRSSDQAIKAIINGLKWLGINHDGDIIYQSHNIARHQDIVQQLLDEGKAYYCYASAEELQGMREQAKRDGKHIGYNGLWRDRDPNDAPKDIAPTVRIKMPRDGETIIDDLVLGQTIINNQQLDDFIILRSDGTPTYMLSVVVDDHDMGITHIIRGNDHFTNAARQYQLFNACDFNIPTFAHIPLIHGQDGAKLSKRHNALSVEAYRDMGYLPEAMCNYLARLGWSYGDMDLFNINEAIRYFDVKDIGKSPAQFDMDKLNHVNHHHLRQADPAYLLHIMGLEDIEQRLHRAMPLLCEKINNINDLKPACDYFINRPTLPFADSKAAGFINDDNHALMAELSTILADISDWQKENIEASIKKFTEHKQLSLGKVLQPTRAYLTGQSHTPSMFTIIEILGKTEVLLRLSALR